MIDAIKIQLSAPQRMREGVEALCPIDVFTSEYSLGKLVAKFTPNASATKQQIADAQSYIDAFDWQDEAATQAFLDAKEPNLDVLKKQASQMLAEIDAFIAVASKAEIAELRAEAIASALRQKTLIQAVERLAGKT